MLEHDRIHISMIVLFVITSTFFEINFKFQPEVYNNCFNENHNHYYHKVCLEKCSYKLYKNVLL